MMNPSLGKSEPPFRVLKSFFTSEATRVFGVLRTAFPNTRAAEDSYLEVGAWYAAQGDWGEFSFKGARKS